MRTDYRANRRNKVRGVLHEMRRADRKRRWEDTMKGWKLQDQLDLEKQARDLVEKAEEVIKNNPPFQKR